MSRGMEIQKGEDHNEMVLDADSWVRNLPRTVEAVFAIPTHDPKSTEEAKQVHRNYLKEHGLTAADVPMLLYDKTKSVPFSVL
jgi:formiminotetrahydrofolate cyclodeaminase